MEFSNQITVFSSIVTGISIVIAGLQISQDSKSFLKVRGTRKKAWEGKWIGKFQQHNKVDNNELTGDIMLNIRIKRRTVIGTAEIHHFHFQTWNTLLFKGGFKTERFLSIEYTNKIGGILQFGHAMLELSGTGEQIKGKIMGYGPQSGEIVSVDICLKRGVE